MTTIPNHLLQLTKQNRRHTPTNRHLNTHTRTHRTYADINLLLLARRFLEIRPLVLPFRQEELVFSWQKYLELFLGTLAIKKKKKIPISRLEKDAGARRRPARIPSFVNSVPSTVKRTRSPNSRPYRS